MIEAISVLTRLDLITDAEREILARNRKLTNEHADGKVFVTPKTILELRASNEAAMRVYRLQKKGSNYLFRPD